MADWQPIETAPRDGTWILGGWFESKDMRIVFWAPDAKCFQTVPGMWVAHPSNWQPLPEPPK